jgi:hypothetical protein
MKKSVKNNSNKREFSSARFNLLDLGLTKLVVFFATLFLVTFFPRIASYEWRWAFLIIALLLSIKPMRSYFKK